MVEELDEIARAANIAAQRADGFRECADLHVHAAVKTEVIDGAAPVAAQHAGSMGVVHHHDSAVFFCQLSQLRQRANVAVHGEDAVGDDQLAAGLVLDLVQQLFGVGGVLVAEDLDFGAGEPRAVDDAGVVQLVGDDEIFFAQQRRHRARIRREARLKDHAGFDIFEARDPLLQLHVDLHGAGDGAHGARTDAVLARGFEGGFAQFGMGRQAQVIVGGDVDDLLAVEGAQRRLLVVEHAQLEVGALLLQFVELVGEVRQGIGASARGCHEGLRVRRDILSRRAG